MNTTNLALTLLSVLSIAVGQVFFKLAARSAAGAASNPWALVNPWLAGALAIYAFATVLWVWVLKTTPLNIAYPFMGFAFVVVPVLAAIFLGEPLDWRVLAGGLLVTAGVVIASWR